MYEVGTITYSVPPIHQLEKGGQGAHDIFRRGRGISLRRWGMWPIIISKGGHFPNNKYNT